MSGKRTNYAFIDSQNLNLGIKSLGWTLDFRKFRQFFPNKNDQHRRSVETLGLSGHGDTNVVTKRYRKVNTPRKTGGKNE
ncbi:MAG: hypothetical protein WAW80_04870 [Candidatus Saccharimonadales bacterium]